MKNSGGGGGLSTVVAVDNEGHEVMVLIDTGADDSFVSAAFAADKRVVEAPAVNVQLADGRMVKTGLRVEFSLSFKPGSTFTVSALLVDDLSHPVVVGYRTMRDHGFYPDPTTDRLRLADGSSVALMGDSGPPGLCSVQGSWGFEVGDLAGEKERKSLREIFDKHTPLLFANAPFTTTFSPTFQHHIPLKPNTRPIFCRPYDLSPPKAAVLKTLLDELEEMGILVRSSSAWGAPVFLVEKKGGEYRMVVDFRKLNEALDPSCLNMVFPIIHRIFDGLARGRVFSRLDLKSGFYSIPLAPDDIPIASISTVWGTYSFTRAPMGLANSPASMQRLIEELLLEEISSGSAFAYVDDVLLVSASVEEQLLLIDRVCKKFVEGGVQLAEEKCVFLTSSVDFLGHVVEGGILKTNPDTIATLTSLSSPQNIKQLRSLIGLINYYSPFIPNFSARLKPLTQLLKKDALFVWGVEQERAKADLVGLLASDPVLSLPDWGQPFILETDGCADGFGAVLSQVGPDGKEHPVKMVSRSTVGAEKHYGATDLETAAIVFAYRKLNRYLHQPFLHRVDHQPAIFMAARAHELVGKQARAFAFISTFPVTLEYRKGEEHGNADALSRLSPPVSLDAAAREMAADDAFVDSRLCHLGGVADAVADADVEVASLLEPSSIEGDIGEGKEKTLVLVKEVHEDYHYGVERTIREVVRRFGYIPFTRELVGQVVSECKECQQTKSGGGVRGGNSGHILAERTMEVVAVDIVGPKAVAGGEPLIYLAFVDIFTRYLDFSILPDMTSEACVAAMKDIFGRLGECECVMSDNGSSFRGLPFTHFLEQRRIDHHFVTPLAPSSNGVVERTNRVVGEALRALLLSRPDTPVKDLLRDAVAGYNRGHSESLGMSPFEAFYGRVPATSIVGELVGGKVGVRQSAEKVERVRGVVNARRKELLDSKEKDSGGVVVGAKVFYANTKHSKLEPDWSGPYLVTSTAYGRIAEIEDGGGLWKRVTFNQLKLSMSLK